MPRAAASAPPSLAETHRRERGLSGRIEPLAAAPRSALGWRRAPQLGHSFYVEPASMAADAATSALLLTLLNQ